MNEDFDDSDELKCRRFSRLLDHYLMTAQFENEEEYHTMTPLQQRVIQTIKRAFKRITK